MTFAERLRQARAAKRLTQAELARLLGVTRNAVSMWEKQEPQKKPVYPKSETMQKLAVTLEAAYDWLATGRPVEISPSNGLPLRGDIAAGVWVEVVENQDVEEERVAIAPDPRYPPHAQYALKVRGTSVNRIAQDGSTLHCVDFMEAGLEPQPGDLVWVERKRGELVEATVKRLRKGAGGLELWPESDDPKWQEKTLLRPRKGEAEVVIRGLVLSVLVPIPRG